MAAGNAQLKDIFIQYCNYGMGSSTSKTELTSTNWGKLCKERGLNALKGKKSEPALKTANEIVFSRHVAKGKLMGLAVFEKALADIAKEQKKTEDEVVAAVIGSGSGPQTNSAAKVSGDNVVGRLTDTSQYTGAHKERFDESGKGKGASGRRDDAKNTGYVGNYKEEGTYDKKK